jgi:hypothetical protein
MIMSQVPFQRETWRGNAFKGLCFTWPHVSTTQFDTFKRALYFGQVLAWLLTHFGVTAMHDSV